MAFGKELADALRSVVEQSQRREEEGRGAGREEEGEEESKRERREEERRRAREKEGEKEGERGRHAVETVDIEKTQNVISVRYK